MNLEVTLDDEVLVVIGFNKAEIVLLIFVRGSLKSLVVIRPEVVSETLNVLTIKKTNPDGGRTSLVLEPFQQGIGISSSLL